VSRENRQRTQTLDGLAWASLTEKAVIARLANKLVKSTTSAYGINEPYKTAFQMAIRETVPPRGRAGPMLEPLIKEYQRQAPIFMGRLRSRGEWEAWKTWVAERTTRIDHAYATVFGRARFHDRRDNPYDWSRQRTEYEKWHQAEETRDNGDKCVMLVKDQDCVIALLMRESKGNGPFFVRHPHIRVKCLGSGRVFTTYLRSEVWDMGQLLAALGGHPVLGALAHGHRVDVDWRGRRFVIHDPVSGETHEAPWLIRRFGKPDPAQPWAEHAQLLSVIGRKVVGPILGDQDAQIEDGND
jgi:hypothetical protein